MSRTIKRLNKRAPIHRLTVNVLLPTHCCRGNWHASVGFDAEIIEGELVVSVQVNGEDFRGVLDKQWRFSAEYLGVSASEKDG